MKAYLLYLIPTLIFISACKENNELTSESTMTSKGFHEDKKIVDLSHEYSDKTIYWVTAEEFKLDTVFNGETPKGYFYSANNFSTAEHGGTHIDAPIHFAARGQSVEKIPLRRLIGHAIKINVKGKALKTPDYLITIEDLTAWEEENDIQIPERSIVLIETGYSSYYPDKLKYLGTTERGEGAVKELHFPGLAPEAAQWLVDNRNINAIGIDTPSIDYGQSDDFQSHVILLGKDIPAFENLTNLNKLPVKGFEIIALPMKIKGGSGAPLRVIALIKE